MAEQATGSVERRPGRTANRLVRPTRTVRRRVPRRTVAVSVGAAVLLAVGGGAYALTRPLADRYTTATAQTGTVTQTVAGPGTVASVSSAAVAFQVAGSVATVDVAPGDPVDAGQTLATLDLAALEAAVTAAQQTLDEARQQLADDQSAQRSTSGTGSSSSASATGPSGAESSSGSQTVVAGPSGAGPSGAGPSSTPSGPSGSAPGSTSTSPPGTSSVEVRAAVAEVTAAQEALLSAYAGTAAAQAASSAALAALSATGSAAWCAQLVALDPTQVTVGSSAPATAPAEEGPTGEPSGGSGTSLSTVQGWVASCQAALTEIAGLQTATGTAQQALSSAMTTLDAKVVALQRLVGSSDGTGTPSTDPAGSGPTQTSDPVQTSDPSGTAPSGTTSPSGASADPSGRSSVPTAADLVADQAAIDAAAAQLAVVTADLRFATLTAPLSGTVAAVDLAVGDQVAAGSTTATITVLGTAGYQVSLPVGLGSVDVVQVGQSASVTVPSTDQTLDGTVTSIGVLNVSTDATPQYTVTVLLVATAAPLYDGSSAQVTITVAGASDVLTVPTSAVRVDGTTVTVDVLADGKVRTTTVVRGAVGAELTEIRDGLAAGDTVVLADRTQPLQDESAQIPSGRALTGQPPGGQSGSFPLPGGQSGSFQRPGG
ncbi:MAG: HlyD family efflux transporter periplasmic adaptor subunit [Micrococcales bacterium]|nr:HlyD family efflux transporter periplasmic adaptor subunit [Micrococcales bacterium]